MTTEDPAYAEELRRRLEILRDHFKNGKIRISKDIDIEGSLLAVRYGTDGKIDLNTVDSKVRALALAVTAMHDREGMKKDIPLREIQETYFTYIERNFKKYYETMKERGLTPHDAGMALSRRAETIKEIVSFIPEFVGVIAEFWSHADEPAWAHLEDMQCLKGVFGGDLFPSYKENLASKCGIYADTIIIPDPFIRSKELFERWSDKDKAYYFIKHAMSVLEYKQLALADVDPPIVAILPDPAKRSSDEQRFLVELGKSDAIEHARILFGRSFGSFEELFEFARSLDTPEKVLKELKQPNMLLFDTAWERDPEKQLINAINGDTAELLRTTHPGVIVASQMMGRMAQSNEILLRSRRFRGVPVIDAPTSWQYFVWKLRYDAVRKEVEGLHDLHMVKGLQHVAENEMRWLGRIPPKALIEIRKEGALEEIRKILGQGVTELAEANPDNFFRSADQIITNIQNGFDEHQKRLNDLAKKKWRFAGVDLGTWLAVGTLEVAAAATGMPIYGLSAIAANQVVDAPKLKDIPASLRKLIEEDQHVKKSPVGLLFKYRDE